VEKALTNNTDLSLRPLFVRTDPKWYILAVSTTSIISATWKHVLRSNTDMCKNYNQGPTNRHVAKFCL